MSDEKVYKPEEIEDSPFPNEDTIEGFDVSQSTSGDKINAPQIKDQKMPSKRIAQELIGTALNTKSQKILKEFEFTDSGAIKVGEYENGVSGDLKISPNGLVARNDAGTTTFAIDGTSGDAVFKGTVQAGSVISGIIQADSVISGDVTVGGDGNANGSIAVLDENNDEKITIDKDGMTINDGKLTIKDEDGTTIIDEGGLVTDAIMGNSYARYNYWILTINNTTYEEIPNLALEFEVRKTTNVLLFLDAYCMKDVSGVLSLAFGIQSWNYTTSAWSGASTYGVLTFEPYGIYPKRMSASMMETFFNTRGSGLTQKYRVTVHGLVNAGDGLIYTLKIAYLKLNG